MDNPVIFAQVPLCPTGSLSTLAWHICLPRMGAHKDERCASTSLIRELLYPRCNFQCSRDYIESSQRGHSPPPLLHWQMVLKIRLLRGGGGATGLPAQWSRIACGGAGECAGSRRSRCSGRFMVEGGRRRQEEQDEEPVAVLLRSGVDRVTLSLCLAPAAAVACTPLITLFIGARSQS